MKDFKYINTGKSVTLTDLVFSGDVDGTEIVFIFNRRGQYLGSGEWFDDRLRPYMDRLGTAKKYAFDNCRVLSFRLEM